MWYKQLEVDFLVKDNFRLQLDDDRNLKFIRKESDRHCIIWIRYDQKTKELLQPYCSIVFLELQGLWVDLCYEAIAGKVNFIPSTSFEEWRKDHCFNPTINTDQKVKYQKENIVSKFESPSMFGNVKQKIDVKSSGNIELFKSFLKTYYDEFAKHFFLNLRNLNDLDVLTNDLGVYELSCYLTQIPVLKKILLMNLTNNPKKSSYTSSYKSQLEPHLERANVAAIMSSVENIESYFEAFTFN